MGEGASAKAGKTGPGNASTSAKLGQGSAAVLGGNAASGSGKPAAKHVCDLCDPPRIFGRLEHKTRHVLAVHTKQRPFPCHLCTCAFGRRDLLVRHVRTIHDDIPGNMAGLVGNPGPPSGGGGASMLRSPSQEDDADGAPQRKKRKPNVSLLLRGKQGNAPLPPASSISGAAAGSGTVSAAITASNNQQLSFPALSGPSHISPSSMRMSKEAFLGASSDESYSASLGLLGLLTQSSPQASSDPQQPLFLEPLAPSEASHSWQALHHSPVDLIVPRSPSMTLSGVLERSPARTSRDIAPNPPVFHPALPLVTSYDYATETPAAEQSSGLSLDDSEWWTEGFLFNSVINANPPIDWDASLDLFSSASVPSFDTLQATWPTTGNMAFPMQTEASRAGTPLAGDLAPGGADDHETLINPPGLLASNWPSPRGTPESFPSVIPAFKSYAISADAHKTITEKLEDAFKLFKLSKDGKLPFDKMPSRHGISRYFKGFMDGFHRHFPFIHKPTFHLVHAGPVLALAILSLGAQYVFERKVALRFYDAAKELLSPLIPEDVSKELYVDPVEEMQARLLLMVFGTWSLDRGLLQEALSLQSQIAMLLRVHGLGEPTDNRIPGSSADDEWHAWVEAERERRTKWTVYAFFNLQSTTYNVPPAVFSSEINMRSCSKEDAWRATSGTEWKRVKGDRRMPFFQDQLAALFNPEESDDDDAFKLEETPSEFASYILISAILQSIFLQRQSLGRQGGGERLFSECTRTLRRWQAACNKDKQPSLHAPVSPLAFNGSAMLRLAYIRLLVDFGAVRSALTRNDAELVAKTASQLPPVTRGTEALKAASHAAQALRIPTKIGIELAARTQAFVWSLQHSLCSFECALLLSKWIDAVVAAPASSLTKGERDLLAFVEATVAEDTEEEGPLSARTLKVWAKVYNGTTTWNVTSLMGRSLRLVADRMEEGSVTPFPA